MRINRIHLQRFGCFDDLEVQFQPGINVIKGPNEAGKSTLHQALLLALLERPTKKKSTELYRSWGQEHWYRLDVEFVNDQDGPWILSKDFDSSDQVLSDAQGNDLKGSDQVQAVVESALGTTSLGIFKSTVCVSQDALTDISAGRKEIAQSLEQIVTGGDEDVRTESAIKALEERVREYRRGYLTHAPVNPGPIARLEVEQKHLSDTVKQFMARVEDRQRDLDERRKAKERLAEIEEEFGPRQALLARVEQSQSIKAELDKWTEREQTLDSRLESIFKAEQAAEVAGNQLEELQPVSEATDEQIQLITRLHERVEVLSGEKERVLRYREEQRAKSAKGKRPARSSLVAPGLVTALGIVGVLFGFLALALSQNQAIGGTITALGLLVALVGIGWLFIAYSRSGRVPSTVAVPEIDQAQLTAAQNELNQKLAELKCADVEELDNQWKQVQTFRRLSDKAEAQLKGMIPEGKTKEELEEARRVASRKRRDAEEQLSAPELEQATSLDMIEVLKLQEEVSILQTERQNLENSLNRLAGKLEEPSVTREDLLRAEEQLATVEAELERAKERLAVYELALETMEAARSKTLKRAQDELAPRLGDYLERLTLGRFSEVAVDGDLRIMVRHPSNTTDMVEPGLLSNGSQDQLYMAARLALVDLLFAETRPPIFLDDPFVKFDPQRRQAAIELCQQIAEDRQVLLFTCSDHYDQTGHLIELKGAS
jgi:uncharacterized protein YhaN